MEYGRSDARDSLRLLLGASVVTIALWYIPFAGFVTYPVRLLVTYIHEICHALMAVLTLGWPLSIALMPDGSGVTLSMGGVRFFVQAAGYTVTPLVGALLLILSARRHTVRPTLVTLGVILLVITLWLGSGLLTYIAGFTLGSIIAAIGVKATPGVARFSLSFLAVQCMLNAIGDLQTLFVLSVSSTGVPTDAHLMAEATGGIVPPVLWAAQWIVLSLSTLALAVAAYAKMLLSSRASY
jgi:hypothetical protein